MKAVEQEITLGAIEVSPYARWRSFSAGKLSGTVVKYRDYFNVEFDGDTYDTFMVTLVEVSGSRDWSGAVEVGIEKLVRKLI